MLKRLSYLGLILLFTFPDFVAAQDCFSFTPSGLHYPIVITDAIIDGLLIEPGDEIGVFDGDLCVGAGIFDGTFTLTIAAWRGDENYGLPGFVPGNPMIFKICDSGLPIDAVQYIEVGDGNFDYGLFAVAALAVGDIPLGDVNHDGTIDGNDSALVVDHILDRDGLTILQQICADVDQNSLLTIEDVIGIVDLIP